MAQFCIHSAFISLVALLSVVLVAQRARVPNKHIYRISSFSRVFRHRLHLN